MVTVTAISLSLITDTMRLLLEAEANPKSDIGVWFGGPPSTEDPSGLGLNPTPQVADIILDGEDISGEFGKSFAHGDINGDGLSDIVVGDPRGASFSHGLSGTEVGLVWIYLSDYTSSQSECYHELPKPDLKYTGSEDYTVRGQVYTRYKLEVTNSSDFPDEFFAPAPHLTPCGLNTNASRTWVDIYDNHNNRLYGFCALSSSDSLNSIWFARPKGIPPPESVYIELKDRECNNTYTSNLVSIARKLDLSGTWLFTHYLGKPYGNVKIAPKGDNKYYLSHPQYNFDGEGLYEIQDNHLVMIKGINSRYSNVSWEIRNDKYLYLTNTSYRGSTLTR